jgi:hypothetical protein
VSTFAFLQAMGIRRVQVIVGARCPGQTYMATTGTRHLARGQVWLLELVPLAPLGACRCSGLDCPPYLHWVGGDTLDTTGSQASTERQGWRPRMQVHGGSCLSPVSGAWAHISCPS